MSKPFNKELFDVDINEKYRSIIHKRASQLPKKFEVVAEFPKNCLIELTNACNHECIFCNSPRMKRKINSLEKGVYERFVKDSVSLGMEELGLYATGEPFLTKDINWFISTAKSVGIKRVYVTTNGSLANLKRVQEAYRNGLDSIKFSINSSTKENYKLVHGKDDFEKVKKNISDIWNWKKSENINLEMLGSFIYTDKTKNEIDLFKKTFDKYLSASMVIPAGTQGGRFTKDIKKISSPANNQKKPDEISPCSFLWDRIILTCEGFITACAVDYELDLVYADYKNTKFSIGEIWNNQIIKSLRKRHLEKKLDNLVCKNCLLGTNEKYEKIFNVNYKSKVNFLKESRINERIKNF